jgi:hypothetical protein
LIWRSPACHLIARLAEESRVVVLAQPIRFISVCSFAEPMRFHQPRRNPSPVNAGFSDGTIRGPEIYFHARHDTGGLKDGKCRSLICRAASSTEQQW